MEPGDFEILLAQARANLSRYMEMGLVVMKENEVNAKVLKAAFDSLIKEGFTEAQALEVVKARGWRL